MSVDGSKGPAKRRVGRVGRLVGGAVALLVAGLVGGPWVYIHLIKEKVPPKLTFDALDTVVPDSATATSTPPDSTVAAVPDTAVAGAKGPSGTDLSGSWTVAGPSTAGYRVKEILFGQSTEGVGRTTSVTGSMTINGSTLTAGTVTVDLTTLKSDADRRDSQVQGRLLETATNPTATFTVKGPVTLPGAPGVDSTVTLDVPGSMHLHGVDKDITIPLTIKRTVTGFQVTGSSDIVFADYGIVDPSNAAVKTENHGLLELAITFVRS
jgi:polyisoprenoid-binding protein YceI